MNIIKKVIISRKLAKLAKIASQKTSLREELSDEPSSKSVALEEYLLTSIEFDDVHDLTLQYGLNLDSFHDIYADLLRIGLGQWINGSYAALSTISNGETLDFYLIAKSSKIAESDIAETLFEYWSGSIKRGSLAKLINT
ncbi:MAG: hypothetical protein ACTH58_16070 [Marinomonas foliarum]|uniref:hypothetical protein n=1 Tax=Marinomonas foliarum TaxID=491950 RepID=UPI003F963DB1